MLVARTIFLTPGGGLWKMFCWSIMGMLECTGESNQSQSCPAELLLVPSPPASKTGGRNRDQLPMVMASSFLTARHREKSSTSHLGRPHFSCFNLWLSSSRSSAHLLSQSLLAPQEYPWQKSHSLPQPPRSTLSEVALSEGPWLSFIPALPCHGSATLQEFPAAAEENRHFPPNYTRTY